MHGSTGRTIDTWCGFITSIFISLMVKFWTNRDLIGLSASTPTFIWNFETRGDDLQTLRTVAETYKKRVRMLLMDGYDCLLCPTFYTDSAGFGTRLY